MQFILPVPETILSKQSAENPKIILTLKNLFTAKQKFLLQLVVSVAFMGTLSSRSGAVGIDADLMERCDTTEVTEVEVWNGVESTAYSSIYFDEYLSKKDKYSYYLGTNQPIVRIKTDSDGGRLLLFKDSYAHIMSQLMTGDWSEIVLVDLRYVREKIDVLLKRVTGSDITEFDTALFLYSAETFTTPDNMLWIK